LFSSRSPGAHGRIFTGRDWYERIERPDAIQWSVETAKNNGNAAGKYRQLTVTERLEEEVRISAKIFCCLGFFFFFFSGSFGFAYQIGRFCFPCKTGVSDGRSSSFD
jgi:hypothetical protein